jgi:hypothetical protein
MALISKTIANLINGVSQQPPSIRNPTQCEVQENYLSDVALGNCHRPHTSFVAKFASLGVDPDRPHFHTIDQGSGSRYKVMITNGDLKVFDLETGAEKTVSFPDGKAYLAAANPYQDFQCLTIGDRTYVLNKTVETAEEIDSTDPPFSVSNHEALVFIKQGDYSTDYKVTITATYAPPGSPTVYGPVQITKTTSPTDPDDIKTAEIAADLKTGIDAAALGGGIFVTRSGSVLHIYTDGGDPYWSFQISVEDSKGNQNMRLIRSQIQKFSDLPTVAPNDYIVQVVGDKASGFDDYYVRFRTDDGGAGMANGAWEESGAGRSDWAFYKPAADTMPLVLIDNGDGTFTCEEQAWDYRDAGDVNTNPSPPFIGSPIDQMFTFGNRLGFLYGGKVSLSEVGIYTNFYLTTVTTFLDSDPIHIQELNGFDRWLFAVPLAEKIVLFSQNGQAVIKADGLLTPKTATIEGATRYPVAASCQPLLIGDNIYFAAKNGDHSRVYEYYTRGDVEVFQAAEVTSHCPRYIPSNLIKLAGDDAAKLVVAVAPETNEVFIYKYFWIGDQKVQSCWSKFVFPENLQCLDAWVGDNQLYLVSMDPNTGDVLYHKMDLDLDQVDADAKAKTHLDLRLDGEDLTSATVGDYRIFTLPFSVHDDLKGSFRVYRKEAQSADPRVTWGQEVEIESWPADNQIRIEDPDGDIDDLVWIGTTFTSRYTLSEIHLKDEQNGAQVPTEEGRLTLKKISFLYDDSFHFRVQVTPKGRDTKTYTMTPYVLGDPTPLEDVGSRSGRFSVPVNTENTKATISIVNSSVVPHRLLSAEWVGQYSLLSRRF